MTPAERYHHDPIFHHLVEILRHELEAARMTPTEVREAAMFAQILYEQRNPRAFPTWPDPRWIYEEPTR